MNILVILLTLICIKSTLTIPILSNDEIKLNSIVISEMDFPTEPSIEIVVVENENSSPSEPEKSFHELIERYDEMYIKNSNIDDNLALHKRSSSDENLENSDDGGKSIIEKIEISDPDIRKEFENELSNQVAVDVVEKTTESINVGTEYDPNYEGKMIIVQLPENSTTQSEHLTVHEKENLQAHIVEQIIHQNEGLTTVIPVESLTQHNIIKNSEIVEVLEHIVYESDSNLKAHEHTTLNPAINLNIDIDPIEIIPKDRHRIGKIETSPEMTTDKNDKFAGFAGIPTKDLADDGDETTEVDQFFIKKVESIKEEEDSIEAEVEALKETLEIVAIYGKSLNIDNASRVEIDEMKTTTTASSFVESETEIVEVNTKISVSLADNEDEVDRESKKIDSSEESMSSISNKSSEESSSHVVVKKVKKTSSSENNSESSEEENSGKEIFDSDNTGKGVFDDKKDIFNAEKEILNIRKVFDTEKEISNDENSTKEILKSDLRILDFPQSKKSNSLVDEIFKDSSMHEIKKKDHPNGLTVPYENMSDEKAIAKHLDDKVKVNTEVVTLATVYETFEEVYTTISDGIKLSNELRMNIDSFRDSPEESKIVLDTYSKIISSKNSKNPLVDVNIQEMATMKERSMREEPKLSMVVIPIVALLSITVLASFYVLLKRKASTVAFY